MSNSPPHPETETETETEPAVNPFDFLREAFDKAGYGPNGEYPSDGEYAPEEADDDEGD